VKLQNKKRAPFDWRAIKRQKIKTPRFSLSAAFLLGVNQARTPA
jgi:hypothetical protein